MKLVLFFVLGAVGGALCDQIHVQFGVLAYPEPFLLGQAWWVPPLFGGAAVAIFVSAQPFARALGATPRRRDFVTGAAWFLGAYFASGIFQDVPVVLSAAYVATWLGRLPFGKRPLLVAAYSLLLAAAGTGFEAALSSTGAFTYTAPDWIVPMWLGGLYLHGAPLALAVAERFRG